MNFGEYTMTYFAKLEQQHSSTSLNMLYNTWLNYTKNEKTGYFLVSNGIKDYLPLIKSPAINLYIYYCYHANNKKGDSFVSIDTMAKDLNVSPKTINNWNAILSDLGLICRLNRSYTSSKTQLLPTSNFIIDTTQDNSLDYTATSDILTNELGYKRSIRVTIIFLKEKPQKAITYDLFSRDYEIKDKKGKSNSINRLIALIYNTSAIKSQDLPDNKQEWSYCNNPKNTDDLLNITLLTTLTKISNKDTLEILKDLNKPNGIIDFKKFYPEYKAATE